MVLTADVGTLGCTRSVCAEGKGLNANPGVRVGGFLGGNVSGIVEIGTAGGWGKVTPQGVEGRQLPDMFGIDATQARSLADELDFDLDSLRVQSAESSAANGGFGPRIHFIPRGRVTEYAGSEVAYTSYRSSFATAAGAAKLDFHGVGVPIEGCMAVYVHPKIAVAAQFDYLWTHYIVTRAKLPEQQAVAPVGTLDQHLDELGDRLFDALPHSWTATVGLRVTI